MKIQKNYRYVSIGAILLLSACVPSPETPKTQINKKPKLVVSIVLDQVGTWVLAHHLPFLSPDGLIRRTIEKGAYYHRAVYEYAGTHTAPGHAAIYTGASAFETGITTNKVWNFEKQRETSIFDDGQSSLFGVPGSFASPTALQVDGIADQLKKSTMGKAKVVSIANKDRSAILPGGKTPDIALWYSYKLPGFTTTSYYQKTFPQWLEKWQGEDAVLAQMAPWKPLRPEQYQKLLGPDDRKGEASVLGKTTFPHEVKNLPAAYRYRTFLLTPQSDLWLLSLAKECVTRFSLGKDEIPDLLALSISGTDYVGHFFGPKSWESIDYLIRIDMALGEFISELEQELGPVSVLITADHGIVPLPEQNSMSEPPAKRIEHADLVLQVETALDQVLGEGDWVTAFLPPFLYLSQKAKENSIRKIALGTAVEALQSIDGIEFAGNVETAPKWHASSNLLYQKVARSIFPGVGGDIFVLPSRFTIIGDDEVPGAGTVHGSHWAYDTEVPVLIAGPGVAHLESKDSFSQTRVAATLAALFGILPPEHVSAKPLSAIQLSP